MFNIYNFVGSQQKELGYYIVNTPTGNCQMFSIIFANNILGADITDEQKKQEFINAGIRCERKRIAFIDVSTDYTSQIDEIFKENIILKSEYISTNDSMMCIYLIKIPYAAY